MSVTTVSRGTLAGGRELAERLADRLGCACVSREDLAQEAARRGVPVEKLRAAMARPPRVHRYLGNERCQYLACMTMLLCERILREDIVYYGHAAQMLLCGVPNVLRVRVLAHPEFRIASVIHKLGLGREEAKKHIEQIDLEREKWVRFLYGVDWNDPALYDIVVHIDQMGLNNATAAVAALAQLPDFKLTPASTRALQDLYLGAKAHFTLASDPRTSYADVRVSADHGVVQVIYLPKQSEVVPLVQEVLAPIEGIKEVSTTIAQSSVLFLQDGFDHKAGEFSELLKIAAKWDAAVELMRFRQAATLLEPEAALSARSTASASTADEEAARTNGAAGDANSERLASAELSHCLHDMRQRGCSGGSSTFCGDAKALLNRIARNEYCLVVLGELFKNKPEAMRIRLKDELRNFLSDNSSVPIVETAELKARYGVGLGTVVRLGSTFLIAALIFAVVFTYQEQVTAFLTGEAYRPYRIVAVAAVLVVTPLFAYAFGTFTRELLKLLRLD